MQIKTTFPHRIREIENTWIPLSDGSRLAVRIWLPEDAERNPVPAILEYLPYRKNDFTALRDSIRHPYFAGHGYASVRVDMRGSGDSDGILYDEYLPQEQDDALEVLAWLAEQPWCTGAVGMIGISWGGFNGLQVAARRPPQLKAVISLCSTDDRYADDVHYMGGCVNYDALPWASIMLAYNALPPDPRFVGDRWREMWLARMEQTPAYIETWLRHQRRDVFWQHGSVCEDYAAIECPVYLVGGWADGYTNAIPRLLAGLSCPRKGLIGPWSHNYPERGTPGPAIGFMQECLRWWDTWLKGIDTGIMAEPMLRTWLQESVPPQSYYVTRPGHWVADPDWPSPNITPQTYWLNEGRLDPAPANEHRLDLLGAELTGQQAGVWCPYGRAGDMPLDQRPDDALSLCFSSAALDAPIEILGYPEVTLTVAVDQPLALVAVRLCDVTPTGASTLVSWGLLNLTHRDSHIQPSPLEPGRPYQVTVQLNAIGYILPARHRWRVSVSPSYWPHAWPSPRPVTLTLFTGQGSQLRLPVRPVQPADADLADFAPPEGAPMLEHEIRRTASRQRTVTQDAINGTLQLVDHSDDGHYRLLAGGLEFETTTKDTYSITAGEPLSARVQCDRTVNLGRAGWQIRVETSSVMSADVDHFHLTNVLEAYEGQVRVFTKTWHCAIPRDLV
jgi:putative CocE/NonD family hydrolase